jgi:hypothetical protein
MNKRFCIATGEQTAEESTFGCRYHCSISKQFAGEKQVKTIKSFCQQPK